jgi:hypothetical protein
MTKSILSLIIIFIVAITIVAVIGIRTGYIILSATYDRKLLEPREGIGVIHEK